MTPARLLLLSAVVTGAALWAPGAQALTSIQTSSPSLFSFTGSSSSSNVLSFTRFNTNIVGDDKKNVTLLGYDYILSTVTASGTVSLANLSPNPINGPFNSQVSLAFGRIDGPGAVSFNPVNATSAGSLPSGPSSSILALTGSATNVVSPDPYIVLTNPANFTTPPSTPLPSLTSSSASWAYISPPGPLSGYDNAVASGRIAVRWHYSYDLQEVPAPLPLAGAGIAFAWSRGLRRRARGLA